MQRRTALKAIGGIAAGGALGATTLTGSVAAASGLNISAGNAGTVTTDDGDLKEVFVAPKYAVQWTGFDELVDRMRVLVEARLEDGSGNVLPAWSNEIDALRQACYDTIGSDYGGYPLLQDDYVPIFRETPWLDNNEYYPERTTSEGTSGRIPSGSGRVHLFSRASELTNRQDSYWKNTSIDFGEIPPIMLFSDDHPRPDYAGLPGSDADVNEGPGHYLSGFSISGGGNFLNGSYGSAGDTTHLDNETDGTSTTRHIGLRFTVSLRHNDDSVAADPLAMNGEDGYPTYEAAGDPTTWPEKNVGYAGLLAIANSHPAVMVDETTVQVTTENEAASASGAGSLNAEAN